MLKRKAPFSGEPPPVIDLVDDDDGSSDHSSRHAAKTKRARPAPSREAARSILQPRDANNARSISSNASLQSGQAPPRSAGPSDDRNTWSATQQGMSSELVDTLDADDDVDARNLRRYGIIDTKIVGVRYYSGIATAGEVVSLRREPRNPYDSNAIRIDNVAGVQVGHLNRNMAAKLAPLLDDRSIAVEATLTGELGFFDGPMEIHVFGSSVPGDVDALKTRLQDVKLPVTELAKEDRERKKREKERAQQQKAAQKAQEQEQRRLLREAAGSSVRVGQGSSQADSLSSQGASSQWTNRAATHADADADASPSMDDIMTAATSFDPRALHSMADRYGAGEGALASLPLADQPQGLATALLPYQLQGLAWLLDRESPQLPDVSNKHDSCQLWQRLGSKGWTNLATNYTTPTPKLASGGILADDMGLGKTIQMIALIVADPRRKQRKSPTLIVAPLSVMSNWSTQAATHVRQEHGFKTLVYHGANKTSQTAKELGEYDVVFTTYQTVAIEYMPAGSRSHPGPVPRPHGLFSITWRRIVLDEGHNIRNPKSKMAQAAYALLGDSRWVLTGTPIVNNLRDLQSLVRFIGLTGGLEQPSIFSSVLARPLAQGYPNAHVLLQALMSTICLRRMKDMKCVDIRLPELSSHKYTVAFAPEERKRYEALEQEAKGVLHTFETRSGIQTYSHLLEVLLRMRQACNHWKLCGERVTNLVARLEKQKKVAPTPENLQALQDLLQLSIDSHEECAICLEPLHSPCITRCGHAFGHECIERVIETQHKCPLCRSPLADASELVRPAAEFGDSSRALGDDDSSGASSTKTQALLDILLATRKKNASTKTIVFSQWTSFLDMLAPPLSAAGFTITRLDGSMPAPRRDSAISALTTDPDCTVMLASLGVCSVGLNLVAASQVILMDSWWSPAIKDQAVDRVYRLGQTRPVNVFRLVMDQSIENRVLELQADKRRLAMAAFGETRMKRGAETSARLADIQRLLS